MRVRGGRWGEECKAHDLLLPRCVHMLTDWQWWWWWWWWWSQQSENSASHPAPQQQHISISHPNSLGCVVI